MSHMFIPVKFYYVRIAIFQVSQIFEDFHVTPNTKINSKNNIKNCKFSKIIIK